MTLFDLDKISSEIKELEQKTMEDGFWNDTNTSSKVLQDIKSLKGKYNKFNKLSTELKNLEELNYLLLIEKDEELIDELIKNAEDLKGELVVIIDGNHQEKDFSDLSIIDHINIYLKEGKSSKDAIKLVAKDRNIPKSEVYKEYHKK